MMHPTLYTYPSLDVMIRNRQGCDSSRCRAQDTHQSHLPPQCPRCQRNNSTWFLRGFTRMHITMFKAAQIETSQQASEMTRITRAPIKTGPPLHLPLLLFPTPKAQTESFSLLQPPLPHLLRFLPVVAVIPADRRREGVRLAKPFFRTAQLPLLPVMQKQ